MPTLEEVLALVKGKKKLLIEIKKGDDYYAGIEANTLELIRQHRARDWTVIQSFYDDVLDKVGRLQLPTEYMHQLSLRERVRLKLNPDHVGVWPGDGRANPPAETPAPTSTAPSSMSSSRSTARRW